AFWIARAMRSPMRATVASMIRTFAASFKPCSRIAIHAGSTVIAPKNTGPSSVATRNHRVRTRSRNSRLMTASSLSMTRHPLLDAAFEHLLATGDDAHRVAQPLGVVHEVRAEDHRLAAALQLDDGVLERLCVDGIEAAERLVEDHEVGIVQQRADELHLLLH